MVQLPRTRRNKEGRKEGRKEAKGAPNLRRHLEARPGAGRNAKMR